MNPTTQQMIRAIRALDHGTLAVFAYLNCTDRRSVTRARFGEVHVGEVAAMAEDLGLTEGEFFAAMVLLRDLDMLLEMGNDEWAARLGEDYLEAMAEA